MSTWEIDSSHSGIHFSVRHLMISKVRGQFGKFSGTIEFDEAAPEKSKITATIDANSVDTNEDKRDGHLRSPDFLDTAKFPNITFESTKIEKSGKDNFKLTGKLSIHGQTQEVSIDVESLGQAKDLYGNDKVGYSASTHIERKKFGLEWNAALETGGVVVGDRVDINLDIQAVRKKA